MVSVSVQPPLGTGNKRFLKTLTRKKKVPVPKRGAERLQVSSEHSQANIIFGYHLPVDSVSFVAPPSSDLFVVDNGGTTKECTGALSSWS
jgi:hypothetical protein